MIRLFCCQGCAYKSLGRGKRKYPEGSSATCQQCKGEFLKKKHYERDKAQGRSVQKFCSVKCANDAQRTGFIDKNGYKTFNINGKSNFEHRLVMEKKLKRKLFPYETVHHKNGDRLDNRAENLELWSSRHCKGQRVTDKVEFALEILKLYAPEYLENNGADCEVINMSDFINGQLAIAS